MEVNIKKASLILASLIEKRIGDVEILTIDSTDLSVGFLISIL